MDGVAIAWVEAVIGGLFVDDVHAELDTFIADEHGRSGDQLAHLVLAFAAEGAVEGVLGALSFAFVTHFYLPFQKAS